jgi:hypothetical protein
MRAVAIVMVCANHVGLVHVWGGAHILLAVAGYSFARFQLNAVASSGRVRPLLRSIVRIVVPSVLVIAVAYVVTREYDIWNLLLVEHLVGPDDWILGPDGWDPRLNYWFIEVLVVSLLLCAALLSIPAVRRLQRAQPFGFAAAFLGVCLVLRFHPFVGDAPMEPYRPQTTLWIFAVGWAAACAPRVGHRIFVTAAAACGAALPGFFDEDAGRKLVVIGVLLVLIWVSRVPVVVGLRRLTSTLAGASLWIYLTQPLTFEFMEWGESQFGDTDIAAGVTAGGHGSGLLHDLRLAVATVIALAVGVLAWKAYRGAGRYLARLREARRGRLTQAPTPPRPTRPRRRVRAR